MYPASPALLTALAGDHEMSVEVWLLRDPPVLLPIIDGSVTATYRQQVARTASLTMDRGIVDLLQVSTLSDVVVIYTGVSGVEMIPVFTGRLDNMTETETGQVQATCVDRGADVIRAKFESPWTSGASRTVPQEIAAIIADAGPTDTPFVTSVDSSIAAPLAPQEAWEEDRGGALDALASSVNAVWFANRVGSFDLAPNPFRQVDATSVATIRDGIGGSIVTFRYAISREEVANSVTVVVERTDGAEPIRVTVRDADPASPTLWGGPFGKQNKIVKNSTVETVGNAQQMATRLLRQMLATTQNWSITTPHFPLYDPLDVVSAVWRDTVYQMVIEQVVYPLLAINETAITARSLFHELVVDVLL